MFLSFILISMLIHCSISETVKPFGTSFVRNDNPMLILQIIPKVIGKLRENLPNQNIEIFIPSLVKEIQQTMQGQSVSPESMPTYITQLVENLLQQLTGQKGTTAQPNSNSSEENVLDKEMEQKKPAASIVPIVPIAPVSGFIVKGTQLPDLAFDRDPSRHVPNGNLTNDSNSEEDIDLEAEDDLLGHESAFHHSQDEKDVLLFPDDDLDKMTTTTKSN